MNAIYNDLYLMPVVLNLFDAYTNTTLDPGLSDEMKVYYSMRLINLAERVEGFQVGLINRADSAYGFQVGGVNIIRDSELAFCPIVNIGFDIFPNY